MIQVIEKRNGIWVPVYHFDHTFKLNSSAPSQLKKFVTSSLVKLHKVQLLMPGTPKDDNVLYLSSTKANLVKAIFVDSQTFNKSYTLIGNPDQINKYFEHGKRITEQRLVEQLLMYYVLGYCLTHDTTTDKKLYDQLRLYKVPENATINLADLYTTSLFNKCLNYKKAMRLLAKDLSNGKYTALIRGEKGVSSLVETSKNPVVNDIDLWLFSEKYLKSDQYREDCKLVSLNNQFNREAMMESLIEYRFQQGKIYPINVLSVDRNKVSLINHKQRSGVLTPIDEVALVDIKLGTKLDYCLVRLSNGMVFRIGYGDDVGTHSLRFSVMHSQQNDERHGSTIDKTTLAKMFDIVDGLYQKQSYKNRLGSLEEKLGQITQTSGCQLQIDSTNNTQDIVQLYDSLSDNDKVFAFNVLNTVHNFFKFVQSSQIEIGLIVTYLLKLNSRSNMRSNIIHINVE